MHLSHHKYYVVIFLCRYIFPNHKYYVVIQSRDTSMMISLQIKSILLSSSPSRPIPVPYPSHTHPLPVPYLSGLSRPLEGTGTDTIFDFSHHDHHPPTRKIFRSLYSSLSCSLHLPYLSSTPHPPLPVPYSSLAHPIPVPYPPSLPYPLKGLGTDTIFHFNPITHPLPVPYQPLPAPFPSPTKPLPVLYLSLTCPLLLHYKARPYRNSSCLSLFQFVSLS